MKIILATHNEDKLRELKQILKPYDFDILSSTDISIPNVIEDQNNFIDNALKKASEIASFSQIPAIADDSGLEIEALNGAPGVFSSRYAITDEERIAKVLKNLTGVKNRKANFTCALAVASPTGWSSSVEGKVFGHISIDILGKGGFGYDPIFIPDGYQKSFAQFSLEEKNRCSHRYKALQKAIAQNIFEELKKNFK